MPAWFLLPAAVSALGAIGKYKGAAARTKAIEGLKPNKDQFKANTGYLRKYISDLRGRSSSRARTELAMRPALRAVGQQQAQAQRQLNYSSAQQGLAGSGIEAQKRLSLQQSGMQAAAKVGETVGYSELNKARALQQQREGQEMKATMQIGQMEGAAEQRYQDATRQWQGQLAGAEADQTGAMWSGITDTLGSAASGIGGHFQKISQRKQFLDFMLDPENAGIDPEILAKGFEEGGIVDYFKQSSGVQGVFDAELKRKQVEHEKATANYERDLEIEKTEFGEKKAILEEDRKVMSERVDEISQMLKDQGSLPAGEINEIHRRPSMSKRKIKKLKREQASLLMFNKYYIPEFQSKLTSPGEFKGLSDEDSTKILKEHLLKGMKAGVFTREGLVSGYTKSKAKKELSDFMGKAGDMETTEFWSHPYAINNPVAAGKVYESMQKQKATNQKNQITANQEAANTNAWNSYNQAAFTQDDPSTPENERANALRASLSQISGLGLKSGDYRSISKTIQSEINKESVKRSSNKDLAAKWGDHRGDVIVDVQTSMNISTEASDLITSILNREDNNEGITSKDLDEIKAMLVSKVNAVNASRSMDEGSKKESYDPSKPDDIVRMMRDILDSGDSEEFKEVKELGKIVKRLNNSEFLREDSVPKVVNSVEEFNNLPPGTVFIDPNGKPRTKP